MGRWKPRSEDPIEKNEHVGRRLFDQPVLAGMLYPKPSSGWDLNLNNFIETRDREFSLDRLGRTGVDNHVVKYLSPRAEDAGKNCVPPKQFSGWSVIQVKQLENPFSGHPGMTVLPSPVVGDGLKENIYHSHTILPEFDGVEPESRRHHLVALYVRERFKSSGRGLREPEKKEQQHQSRFLGPIRAWFKDHIFDRLRKTMIRHDSWGRSLSLHSITLPHRTR